MRPALALAMILSAFALAACDDGTTGKLPTCTPPQVTNIAGLLHGYPCTKHEECKYGFCDLNALTTAGTFGICTKLECLCGAGPAECSADQIAGQTPTFICISPRDLARRCVPACTSVDQCTAIDARYNTCTNTPPNYVDGSIGVQKFCVVTP